MSEFIPDLFETYGPLSLGWPLAWYFVRQNAELQKKLMEIAVSNIAVNTEVKGAVEMLSEFVKTLAPSVNR